MSWDKKKIKDIATKVTKGTTPTTYGMSFTESGIHYIKAGALNGFSSLLNDGFTFINEKTHEKLSRSQLEKNDVLVTIAGANVGSAGFVETKYLPANTNQAVGIIRLDEEKVNPKFVYYHFKKPSTKSYCLSVGGQSAQPNVNLTVLKSFEIALPNRLTQDRIASILSSYDELIQNNKRRIELLEKSARLLYKEWFVHLRFPGHEHTKITDGVPEGWDVVPFNEVIDFKEGPGLRTHQYKDTGFPFLNIRTFGEDEIDLNIVKYLSELEVEEKYKHFRLKENDHVVSSSGTLGRVVTIRECHLPLLLNTSIIRMRPKRWIGKWFLKAYLKHGSYKDQVTSLATGSAQLNYGPTHLNSMNFKLPQKKYLDLFEERASHLYEQKKILLDLNLKLKKARDLLLPKLMNGELPI